MPLRFVSLPVDTVGVVGDTISLHCNVSGNPISSVQWYKNDVPIPSDPEQVPNPGKHESKRETSQGTNMTSNAGLLYWFSYLTISELNVTDTGIYHCVAEQLGTPVSSTKANLLVLCK